MELEQIADRGHIAGFSVAVVDQQGILYTHGFGHAHEKKQLPYTEHTIQPIASVSKTFIGVALLKAQELGKLKLDDPINNYISFEVSNPYFTDHPITIRHLTTHTSGITDGSAYENYGYVLKEEDNAGKKVENNFRSPDEMMDKTTFLKAILTQGGKWYEEGNFLNNPPGAKFEYSNIGAGLAAVILENATGESFDAFTKKHIFDPLQMRHTGWNTKQVDMTKHSKLYAHPKKELAAYQLVNYPDGGLITSATDLGKYLSDLIAGYNGKGAVLTNKSYQELFQPQLAEENFDERSEREYNDEYNMGVFMGMSSKGQMGHTGGDPGVSSLLFFNTQSSLGKVLIINTSLNEEGVKEFIDVWKKLEAYEKKLKRSY